MPYIVVEGRYDHGTRPPGWKVKVSGLKESDISQLTRFKSERLPDNYSIDYHQHHTVILTALEVLGYKVVCMCYSRSEVGEQQYTWTMRKDFAEPEPEPKLKIIAERR